MSEHPRERIEYPGHTSDMSEKPHDEMNGYVGRGLLDGKRALITGSYFHVSKAAVPHLRGGRAIINTASINGLRGNKSLIVYSATKGAVIAVTYSLSQLRERSIRVNCVVPGPVWTPLIPATLDKDKVESFGQQTPYGRAAQPDEIAPSYMFFASETMWSYYSGEVLSPIGGETLPG